MIRKLVPTTVRIVSIATLLLYPFLFIDLGIDPTDSAYWAVQYRTFLSWPEATSASASLSVVLGSLWGIVFGDSLISFRLFGSLLLSLTAVSVWLVLRKGIHWIPLIGGLLLAEILTRTYVTVGGYNQVSALCLMLATLTVFHYFKTVRPITVLFAGFLLGLASLAKLSSVEWALPFTVGVLFVGFRTKRFPGVELGLAVIGFGLAWVSAVAISSFAGHLDWFISQFPRVFQSAISAGSGHEFVFMLETVVQDYFEAVPWAFGAVALVYMGTFAELKLRRRQRTGPTVSAILAASMAGGLVWLLGPTWTNTSARTVGVLCVLLGVIFVFRLFDRKVSDSERAIAIVMFLSLLVSPLGSNTGLKSVESTLWIACPLAFQLLWDFYGRDGSRNAVTSVLALILTIFALSTIFGLNYVYRDAPKQLLIEAVRVPTLGGLRTTEGRSQIITQLKKELGALPSGPLIQYGALPLAHLVSPRKMGLVTSWPDLPSFSTEAFGKGLALASQSPVLPIVLILKDNPRNSLWPEKSKIVDRSKDPKFELLQEFIKKHRFKEHFSNPHYSIWAAQP